MEDVSKLPKWAAARLRNAEARVATLEAQFVAGLGGQSQPGNGSRIRVRLGNITGQPVYLPEHTYLEMDIGAGEPTFDTDRRMTFSWSHSQIMDNALYCSAAEAVMIHPRASNAFCVTRANREF